MNTGVYKMINRNTISRIKLLGVVCALMLAPVFSPTPLFSQVKTDSPFYVVDIQGALDRSEPGKAAKAMIESEAKSRQEKIEALEQKLEAQRAGLMKQAALLSEEALRQRSGELEKQQQEIAQAVQREQEAINQINMREIGRLVQEIDRIVKSISQEQDIQIVLEKDPGYLIYVDDKFDLTQKVIDKLNQKS